MNKNPTYLESKSHYQILDGLRGVAALTVVIFHTFEAYANVDRFTQTLNHGYLAVDFFFLLSGFVVAYAYDDRWGKMTQLGCQSDASLEDADRDVGRFHLDPSASLHGHPWTEGDAPARRTRLVTVFRVHRKSSLRVGHPQTLQ
jgi:hypothetical protein